MYTPPPERQGLLYGKNYRLYYSVILPSTPRSSDFSSPTSFPPKTCMDVPLHTRVTRVANNKLTLYLSLLLILQ